MNVGTPWHERGAATATCGFVEFWTVANNSVKITPWRVELCIRQMIVVGGYPIPIHSAQHMAGLALAMLNLCTRKAKKLLKKIKFTDHLIQNIHSNYKPD